MNQKRKFDKFVSSQQLVAHYVYGSEFSIKLSLKDIQDNNFSVILGCYVNEKKAAIEEDYAYIIPEYDRYQVKTQNYKKQKLLQYVTEKNFITMINQAEIVFLNDSYTGGEKQFYLKISQNDIKKYQCVIIVSLLIDAKLAKLGEDDSFVYIIYNYQYKLEKSSKIQSDLSRFRTLLGECNNLAAMLELVEKGELRNNKLFISKQNVENGEMYIEMMSLVDIGIAEYVENELAEAGYELDVYFASWLLDYISKTSDQVSFGELY